MRMRVSYSYYPTTKINAKSIIRICQLPGHRTSADGDGGGGGSTVDEDGIGGHVKMAMAITKSKINHKQTTQRETLKTRAD